MVSFLVSAHKKKKKMLNICVLRGYHALQRFLNNLIFNFILFYYDISKYLHFIIFEFLKNIWYYQFRCTGIISIPVHLVPLMRYLYYIFIKMY